MDYTPLDFARQFLGEHKIKGAEIIPVYCPICNGGEHRDKYTFALNIDSRTYNCKRGSCGVQGHFSQLCKNYGVNTEKQNSYIPVKKIYKPPSKKPVNINNAASEYIKLRGISETTAQAYKLGSDENGNIMLPYYNEKMEHIFNCVTDYSNCDKCPYPKQCAELVKDGLFPASGIKYDQYDRKGRKDITCILGKPLIPETARGTAEQ